MQTEQEIYKILKCLLLSNDFYLKIVDFNTVSPSAINVSLRLKHFRHHLSKSIFYQIGVVVFFCQTNNVHTEIV